MKYMTIEQLYDYLCSPSFRDQSDSIFYNYYIYQYDARQEYEMRRQIADFKERLKRPANFVNALVIDLFETFCEYLKTAKFGKQTLFDMYFEEEEHTPNFVTQELTDDANSQEFYEFIRDKIVEHISANDGYKHPYVFVHGIGKMFPYMRCSTFLNGYEKYNDPNEYKIIVFYPGESKGNSFKLFNTLDDNHTYRAVLLVNE